MCCLKISFSSIITPKYLMAGREAMTPKERLRFKDYIIDPYAPPHWSEPVSVDIGLNAWFGSLDSYLQCFTETPFSSFQDVRKFHIQALECLQQYPSSSISFSATQFFYICVKVTSYYLKLQQLLWKDSFPSNDMNSWCVTWICLAKLPKLKAVMHWTLLDSQQATHPICSLPATIAFSLLR